mgnify:CR=1 FL=1
MTNWQSIESEYYLHVVNRQPIVLVKGQGTRVWDIDGKEYLDFTSGWAVTNIGHANPVLANAIADQAWTLIQTSNQFYTVPQLQLARLLVENSCLDKVFFSRFLFVLHFFSNQFLFVFLCFTIFVVCCLLFVDCCLLFVV